MALTGDIYKIILPETTQKTIHCLVGEHLFVDKTWCTVKKADVLKDVTAQQAHSPFFNMMNKINAYKPEEMLIGYEPFDRKQNEFIICVTEKGRDEVLNKLQQMRENYQKRIEQSKVVRPREWSSHGSETEVDDFLIRNKRGLISLEWIGDVAKRLQKSVIFEDCDPESMKNGYTCLLPGKKKYDLIIRNTQERGIQAVPEDKEVLVQTGPVIPTNANTQCASEAEIIESESTETTASGVTLTAFFSKHLDYLLEALHYNELYDLYHDDYPALRRTEDTPLRKVDVYKQYQSFIDVGAVEGKLVISTSWHPNCTGVVAIAYASEIPCITKELEYDSDNADDKEAEPHKDAVEGSSEEQENTESKQWTQVPKKDKEKDASAKKFRRIFLKPRKPEAEKVNEETDSMKAKRKTSQASIRSVMDTEYQDLSQTVEEQQYYEPDSSNSEMEEISDKESEANILWSHREQIEELAETEEETLNDQPEEYGIVEQKEGHIAEGAGEAPIHETPLLPDIHHPPLSDQILGTIQEPVKRKRHKGHGKKVSAAAAMAALKKRESLQEQYRRKLKAKVEFSVSPSPPSSAASLISEVPIEDAYKTEVFEYVSTNEKEQSEDLPTLLEAKNPVLIWSFDDDLKPKLQLECQYDVTVVRFCVSDGNYIAGGATSGQVILWDITGRLEALEKAQELTDDQQRYRQIMVGMMNWTDDALSRKRVRVCGVCSHEEAHMGKVTAVSWVNPSLVVTNEGEILPQPVNKLSLIICSTGACGTIKFWNINTSLITKTEKPKPLRTKRRYARPPALDVDLLLLQKLYRKWPAFLTLIVANKYLPFMLSGTDRVIGKIDYIRTTSPGANEILEDHIKYTSVIRELSGHISQHMYAGTIFGDVGSIMWESSEGLPAEKMIDAEKSEWWPTVHDGPVTRVVQHDFIPELCLTVGGHVFAVWHIDDKVDPVMSMRYYNVCITDGLWSPLRPSVMRIARSDGIVEIWDLMIQSHAPVTTVVVSGKIVTNISSPVLPEVNGLLGIADYNSAFRLFYIPHQFQVWTQNELDHMKEFIHREPRRKQAMQEWSKWWRENRVNTERKEKKKREDTLVEDESVESEEQKTPKKKFRDEAYMWYMRQQGKTFDWKEESDERWRAKQEKMMHEVVKVRKKIDRHEMGILMQPLVKEERNEAQKYAKAQARLQEADTIFKTAIDLIFPTDYEVEPLKTKNEAMKEIIEKIDYFFGENFDVLAEEKLECIKNKPWHSESRELLEKYNYLRVMFNDRRRKRSKTLRWLRKKLAEELTQEGYKIHIRRSHKERYKHKRIKRREENIEWLKKTYGDDYDVHWDSINPCRKFKDRKVRADKVSEITSKYEEPVLEEREGEEIELEGEGEMQVFDKKKILGLLERITSMGILAVKEEDIHLDASLLVAETKEKLLGSYESEGGTTDVYTDPVPGKLGFSLSKIGSKLSILPSGKEPTVTKDISALRQVKVTPFEESVDDTSTDTHDTGYTADHDDSSSHELESISQPVADDTAKTEALQSFDDEPLAQS